MFESTVAEIAQVLNNLAGALALIRCEARIIGLSDDRFQKNISWVLNQSWLDIGLRPVFFAASKRLGGRGPFSLSLDTWAISLDLQPCPSRMNRAAHHHSARTSISEAIRELHVALRIN
jgi:hypothetical protein